MKQITNQSNKLTIRRVARFLPAVAWMGVIYYSSSQTGDEVSTLLPLIQQYFPFISDFNWGHFVSYFILALAIDYGIGAKADRLAWKLVIVMICGLYGVTDEYHQSFVGGRMPDIIDIRNDMIGASIWVIVSIIPFIRRTWRKIAT